MFVINPPATDFSSLLHDEIRFRYVVTSQTIDFLPTETKEKEKGKALEVY